MNIVRKYKISKIIEILYNDNEQSIIDYIDDILDNCKFYTNNIYPKEIFIFKNDKEILVVKDNILWVNKTYVDDLDILLFSDETKKFLIYRIAELFNRKIDEIDYSEFRVIKQVFDNLKEYVYEI